MNKEIKEILKILKKCEFGACITKHSSRVLLDYITELQEKRKYDLCFIKHLKEDKKHLQEELDFIKEDANDILYKLTIKEERIYKAIDYITEYRTGWNNWFEFTIEDKLKLIDILKGDE